MPKIKLPWYYTAKNIAADVLRGRITDATKAGAYVCDCVKKVMQQTEQQANGKLRIAVIDETIRKNTRYVAGVAMKLYVSERMVVQYTNDFVYAVAAELGFWE